MARAGVARTIYLGGLEGAGDGGSEHLRSRLEVAEVLARRGAASSSTSVPP